MRTTSCRHRIIDDAVDVVVAKIDEKVEEEAARAATDVGGQPRKGLAQIAGVDYTAAAMTALNTMWECVGKAQDRSRRVQLIGKRCESVALHQAMSDQMGYKAKPLFKKAKRSYEAKERQDSYIDYKAKRREVVFDPWDDILRTYVGATLHDAVMEASASLSRSMTSSAGNGEVRGYCRCLMKLRKPGSRVTPRQSGCVRC